MTTRAPRLSLWIRLWHGLTALLFIALTATGIILHFAALTPPLISYATATTIHDVTGISLAVLYGLHLIFLFATGYWRQYIPARRGLKQRLKAQLIIYTIGIAQGDTSAASPEETRFNALQQLAYLVVLFALLPLLIITGLLYLYYPVYVPHTILGFAGLLPIALAHYAVGILGTMYLIIHVYMATVGPKAGTTLKLMIIGRTESTHQR